MNETLDTKLSTLNIISGLLASLVALLGGVLLHYYVDNGSLAGSTDTRGQLATAVISQNGNGEDIIDNFVVITDNDSQDEGTAPEEEQEEDIEGPEDTTVEEEVPTVPDEPEDDVVIDEPEESGPANLVVTNILVEPNPMDPDQPVRIRAFVQNQGFQSVSNVNGILENITNGHDMGRHEGYSFAPAQEYEFWEENTFPYFAVCDNAGENTLRFTIDPDSAVEESDESDNYFEVNVQLMGC